MKQALRVLGIVLAVVVVSVAALLVYAIATFRSRLYFPDTPPPALAARTDADTIARGRYLVRGPAHCSQCHSVDDRNHPERITPDSPLSGGLLFDLGPIGRSYGANLTPDPETGIGKRSDAELARTLRTGVLHDGRLSIMMRFAVGDLSDDDLVAVISYLRSQAPVRKESPPATWGALGKALLMVLKPKPKQVEAPRGVPGADTPSLERGAYLAEQVAVCVPCHSKADMKTFLPIGPKAGGGDPQPSHGDDHDMEFVTPNLTAHPTGYTGCVDEDYFVKRLKSGRAITSSIMPWEAVREMTDSDLRSIYRYLKSLPPVDHDVGPTYRKRGTKP